MIKKVNFHPKDSYSELLISSPKSAKNYYPDWMKKIPNIWKAPDGTIRKTATYCAPFVDTFTSGYIQELPDDVHFNFFSLNGKDFVEYECKGYQSVSQRKDIENMPNMLPDFYGFYDIEFHWNSIWEPKTPKGYSTLYTHPFNRFDLPFQTFSGIIDTDKWSVTGPVPFLIKKGWSGTIYKGTPIYQINFIKREKWHSNTLEFDSNFIEKQIKKEGGYKKNFWTRKEFI